MDPHGPSGETMRRYPSRRQVAFVLIAIALIGGVIGSWYFINGLRRRIIEEREKNARVEALLQGPNTIEAGLDELIAGGMSEEEAEERVAQVFLRRLQEDTLTRSGINLADYEIELEIDREGGLKMTYRLIPSKPTPLPLS